MISTPVRTTGAITQGKTFTSLALSFAAPTAGNLLITALSVDKTVTSPVAPSGFTIGGTWTGTAGTGLVWAYKLAAAGTETSLTWGWSNSAGAAAVYAEFPTVSATFVSGVVNGTESNVTTLSATAPAPGAGGGLHVGFAAVDSAGSGISPATWPVPGGPSWSGQTQVALQLGSISPDNGASSVAMAAADAVAGSTKPTTMSYSGQADQNALAVGTFTAAERTAAPSFSGSVALSGSGTLTLAGSAGAACTGAEVGAVTQTGATLAFDLTSSAAVRAVVSTSSDLSSPMYGGAATGIVAKSAVGGLAAGTRYYWGVEIGGTLASAPRGSFRTAPATAASFKVVLGSCAGQNTSPYITNAISNAPTFEAMQAVGADLFLHMGDRHYGDLGNVAQSTYVAKNAAVRSTARQAALHHSLATVYHPDDHDGPGNNWTSQTAGAATALAAWDQAIPHHPVAVTGTWAHTFTWGRVRFVVLDTRSKRVAGGTMLGTDQLTWATNLIATATERLVVIDTGVAWIGDGVTGSDATDSWGAFASDRQQIAQAITAARNAGRDVLIVAGDAHMVAVDDGTNSQYDPAAAGTRGPTVLQAAPFDATSSTKGGPYSAGTFTQSRYQFGVLDVVDNGASMVATVTGYTTSTTSPYPATSMVSRTATTQQESGSLALSGSGQLALTGSTAASGAVPLAGSGSLAATGTSAFTGTRQATGSGVLTFAGSPAASGSLAFDGTGQMVAAGAPAISGGRAFSGSGTLTAAGVNGSAGAVALTGSGVLALAGTPKLAGSMQVVGSGQLAVSRVVVAYPPLVGPVAATFASDGVTAASYNNTGATGGAFTSDAATTATFATDGIGVANFAY